MAERIIIDDSVTKPLTKDPIHGKIDIKMKGSDMAASSERTVNAIGTRKYFLLIRTVKAIDMKMKMDVLTTMV